MIFSKAFSINLVFVFIIATLLSLLVIYSPVFSIIVLFAIFTVLVLSQKKEVGFYVLLLLVPIDRFYFPLPYKLKVYQILLLALVFQSVIIRLVTIRRKPFRFNLLDVAVISLYMGRVYSLLISVDIASTIKSLILNGLFVLLYFYVRSKAEETPPQKMLQVMLRVSILCILFGLFEFIAGKLGLTSLQISKEIYVYGGRPSSVFREPDWFGGYLTFIIGLTIPFIGVSKIFDKEQRINKFILYAALFMSLLIVVRSAWLGIIVGVLFVLFTNKKSIKIVSPAIVKMSVVLLISLIFLSGISFLHFKSIQHRFLSIFTHLEHKAYDPAAQVRINSYNIITNYIKDKPVKGYGAGAWEFLSQRHQYINPSLSTNNLLLTPIFEMGILGIILYMLFIYALFKMLFIGYKRACSAVEDCYVSGIAIAIVGTMIVSIFNDIMLTGFYWAFIAIFNNYISSLKGRDENIACAS